MKKTNVERLAIDKQLALIERLRREKVLSKCDMRLSRADLLTRDQASAIIERATGVPSKSAKPSM